MFRFHMIPFDCITQSRAQMNNDRSLQQFHDSVGNFLLLLRLTGIRPFGDYRCKHRPDPLNNITKHGDCLKVA